MKEKAQAASVLFYRVSSPDNMSGKVVIIKFRSCDQVRAFASVVLQLLRGDVESLELSGLLGFEYEASVSGFVIRQDSRQHRDNVVKIVERAAEEVSIDWAATEDAWLDVVALLEPLAVSSGGHQYLTSGEDGAEIVAEHYK